MPQTDRQTDTKATHWKTAVFDLEDQWIKLDTLPEHVKEVHKKKEICPETGKEHYQIHVVCHRQVRLKAMTDWIKRTKWFAVLGADHIKNSIAYISKTETTAPGAVVEVVKGPTFFKIWELLMCLARAFVPISFPGTTMVDSQIRQDQFLYKNAARHLVQQDINWIDKLSNPVIEKNWNYFYREIFDVVEEQEGSFIIEDPSHQDLFQECAFLDPEDLSIIYTPNASSYETCPPPRKARRTSQAPRAPISYAEAPNGLGRRDDRIPEHQLQPYNVAGFHSSAVCQGVSDGSSVPLVQS